MYITETGYSKMTNVPRPTHKVIVYVINQKVTTNRVVMYRFNQEDAMVLRLQYSNIHAKTLTEWFGNIDVAAVSRTRL